jgi:hypothetical protein
MNSFSGELVGVQCQRGGAGWLTIFHPNIPKIHKCQMHIPAVHQWTRIVLKPYCTTLIRQKRNSKEMEHHCQPEDILQIYFFERHFITDLCNCFRAWEIDIDINGKF